MKVLIITDSNCDLSEEILTKYNVKIANMTFSLSGKEYKDDLWKNISADEFYNKMKDGATTSTSQITSYTYTDMYTQAIENGYDHIINIVFSSALSGTYANALMASEEILEQNKNVKISVIDSKSASIGQGILVLLASKLLYSGASFDEIITNIHENIDKINHFVVVDDLNHLKRGGRISAASATIGSILDIKPLIKIDNDGKLVQVEKIKGRKKSLKVIAEKVLELIDSSENQIVGIAHGNCKEDAELLKKLILDRLKVDDIMVTTLCPTLGCHAGPGTIATCFLGKSRY